MAPFRERRPESQTAVSQAYVDLATFSGGMPAKPGGGAVGLLRGMFKK